ncbi:hypothetical protein FA13DRAFT_1719871 [Coprinellus micaceus]|nr:hypothetical protein FA13DRAFT_1719871 [Coprinellus micaceus]
MTAEQSSSESYPHPRRRHSLWGEIEKTIAFIVGSIAPLRLRLTLPVGAGGGGFQAIIKIEQQRYTSTAGSDRINILNTPHTRGLLPPTAEIRNTAILADLADLADPVNPEIMRLPGTTLPSLQEKRVGSELVLAGLDAGEVHQAVSDGVLHDRTTGK